MCSPRAHFLPFLATFLPTATATATGSETTVNDSAAARNPAAISLSNLFSSSYAVHVYSCVYAHYTTHFTN